MISVFVEGPPPRRTIDLTIIAQDPSIRVDGKIVRAVVRIPAEHLDPGPLGHRLRVVDYDTTTRTIRKPGALTQATDLAIEDRFAATSDATLIADPEFRAQNVFAIAARTLDRFEFALGRRVPWSFREHQLFLIPTAFDEANAFYAEEDHAVYFGYFDGPSGARAYACLSHDVIAHETTHAILDGIRARFAVPGLPDQPAFHEAFADIVALLSVFSLRDVVEQLLGRADVKGRIAAASVSGTSLRKTALLQLAEELGESVHGTSGGLRASANLEPSAAWKMDPAFDEPHRRGEVLVAAILHSLLNLWTARLEAIEGNGTIDRARAAEEGAKAAQHLLEMAIRAVDYCPPLEFEFADFIDALLLADAEVDPDDALGYRAAVRAAFRAFGIEPPPTSTIDVLTERITYHGFNYASLRSAPDEVFRFIWENRRTLGIDPTIYTFVENIRPSIRTGPDGFVVSEALVDYVQSLRGKPAEIAAWLMERTPGSNVTLPPDLPPDEEIEIWGGGVLIFDQFGRAKLHQRKAIDDAERQLRRLGFLVRTEQHDTQGRFGFSLGIPRGQRFAGLHADARRSPESW